MRLIFVTRLGPVVSVREDQAAVPSESHTVVLNRRAYHVYSAEWDYDAAPITVRILVDEVPSRPGQEPAKTQPTTAATPDSPVWLTPSR